MYVSSTRSAVDTLLDSDRLSELVGAPVRAARLRIKPGVSVTASLLQADTDTSAGWVRLLWPVSRVKATKAARRAERLGLRTSQRDTGDGLLAQFGEVATDPALVRHVAAARERGLLDGLEGNLLRYNPLRRLVVRTPAGVVRVTAGSQRHAAAVQAFAARYVPVPPARPVPPGTDAAHVSLQGFVGDGDLERWPEPAATARAGAALAALHARTADLPESLRADLDDAEPAAGEIAAVHTRTLTHLDPALAARVHRLGQALDAAIAAAPEPGPPVLVHGDASPDQVLLERTSGQIWLTDFDRARLAPAVVDLGSYLAVAPADAAPALLAGYAQAGGRVPAEEVLRCAVARARLERIQDPLRHGDPQWRRRLGAEADHIERLLAALAGPARRGGADVTEWMREAS
ncbi:MAG: aminoglycoside phosphotransferase family protein [Actinomyces succiniciruminis]|uniref:Phosphotransferase enzyme family n=1 Tax=Actinomyces succiniciruminis TaxID=1522002 RepID=A0A1L7RC82_9ACTO|nr:phosphotransferase [Actinomyces succiniciruminis]MBE6475787.1 aminoglycoside phosphotransferase family protein [Actinomyces succiniciruminis]CED91535.1 Phosphotransferase enzyme family [Actinomyces succiniciruminis]